MLILLFKLAFAEKCGIPLVSFGGFAPELKIGNLKFSLTGTEHNHLGSNIFPKFSARVVFN